MYLPPESLLVFARVVELGSVSRTAEDLGVTQPAVSNRLRTLQTLAGVPLYRRAAEGIEVLPAGRDLLPHARALARALERAAHVVGRDTATVRVALSEAAVPLCTVRLLATADDVGVRLEISACDASTAQERVLTADVDLAVAVAGAQPPHRALERRIVERDPVTVVAAPGHDLPNTLPALIGTTLLWQAPGSGVRATVERALIDAGLWPATSIDVGTSLGVLAAAAAGRGIGLLPHGFAEPWAAAGRVVLAPIEPELIARFEVITPPIDQLSAATVTLLDAITASASRRPT